MPAHTTDATVAYCRIYGLRKVIVDLRCHCRRCRRREGVTGNGRGSGIVGKHAMLRDQALERRDA